jgi:putrescine transport system ATP-binding protein
MSAPLAANAGATPRDTEAPLLRFENVTKRFGAFTAVDDLSIEIRHGEIFALLGPSGCGKSTLLRLAAGFETPDAGRIVLGGHDIVGVPPHLRPVNMMFQSYALFPHMTVADNIAFGLKQDGLPRAAIAERVAEIVALLRLDGLAPRRPDQLSGGQRQRVALARALVKRLKVLLLDEPLGALDKKLRDEMQVEMVALRRKLDATFVVVTHDQGEALSLADRLAVMEHGRIAQVGPPAEVYERPASVSVARFMGDINLLEGTLARNDAAGAQVGCGGAGNIHLAQASQPIGARVWVAVRPEKIALSRVQPADATVNVIAGTVEAVSYFGTHSLVSVRTSGGLLLRASTPNAATDGGVPAAGDAVWASWPADAGVLLDH